MVVHRLATLVTAFPPASATRDARTMQHLALGFLILVTVLASYIKASAVFFILLDVYTVFDKRSSHIPFKGFEQSEV